LAFEKFEINKITEDHLCNTESSKQEVKPFVNIGQNMSNLIKAVDKKIVIHTKDATNNYNSLFIVLSTPQEVQNIIK